MPTQLKSAKKPPRKQLDRLGNPATIYGGIFDLVNLETKLSEADLKFMGLFYGAVVVPDAFLMSYTPLFRHIDGLLNTSNSPDSDIISVFLENGIIVPAIRRGESLLENWTGPNSSIAPATEMRVCTEEGRKVMEFVDRKATRITRIDLKPGTNRFGDILNKFLVGEERPLRPALQRLASIHSPDVDHLVRNFEDLVQSRLASKDLRRLDVERLISQYLVRQHNFTHRRGFIPRLYEQLYNKASDKPRDPGLFACRLLLNSSSTIYQAYHAYQFAALGGLFPFHDRGLIDAGLYDYLRGLPSKVIEHRRKYLVKRLPVLTGSLQVSEFTPEQIADIRETEEFREYVAHLSAWRALKDGETAYEANPMFVDHLKNKYLPWLLKRYPQAGSIERRVKGVSTAAEVLLEVVSHAPSFECVSVKGRMIIAATKATASAIAHYTENVTDSIHSLRMTHRKRKFMKLNQYWAKSGRGGVSC